MRRLVWVHFVCCLTLAVPAAVRAQTATQAPLSASQGSQSPPATQTKPQQTKPQPPKPQPPKPQPPATPAADTAEVTRSLFEPTWHQFEFSGRLSSIDGDPARFQRYGDIRDGVLFTDARHADEHPEGNWLYRIGADNVGWRDQRFFGTYERPGKFSISGLWDEIPQFYSVDTKTPYTTAGDALVLDDATQQRIQSGQGGTTPLNLYVPLAPQFDLRERRDVGTVRAAIMATPQLDVKASYTMQRHVGELPWGASFGFSNDVEVPQPYDSRTNDFNLGAEWANGRQMLRVAYQGTWFDNLDPILVWDSPLDLTDGLDNPGRGRMTLWPSNSAQTVSFAGSTKLARRTQLTGFVSFGSWSNDEPLQPFTINASLPQLPLPRPTTEGDANVFSMNVNFVSRPVTDWRFSARLRRYDYSNETPQADIPQFVSYDSHVSDALISPHLYAHDRTNFDADATWSGLSPVALTAGYTHNGTGHDFRIFESTGENVFYLMADAIGSQWVTFRARYDYADRSGSGLDESVLTEIHEQPALRHYDLANRTRNRFTGQVDVMPDELWTLSVSGGVGEDNFDDSYFGLQESTFRTFSVAVDYQQPNGFGAGASYNFERYAGLQQSRSTGSGQDPANPLQDWTADSTERVNYFSIYASPPRIGERTEVRVSYDFARAEGSYLYTVVPGGLLPQPSQLPEVFNKLQQLHIDGRYRISNRLAASLSYLYEPFDVFDFAFDPSVVNGIVQPSSLVMGYVYRPYTAHSFRFGLRYYW